MASNTPNINLYKKDPVADGNDTFNIKTMLNDNWDKIDSEIGDIKLGIEAIDYPVTSVNNKTGDVVLNAADIGAETPVGSQAKANMAETNANDYTDHEISSLTQTINQSLNNKIDKITGKGLSTNDYTTAEKNKLAGIETGAQKNTVTSVAGKTGAVTLTKSDVGLPNILDYGIATTAEAQAGTSNVKYITPLRLKEAMVAREISFGTAKSATGTYIGNGSTTPRAISVGFKPLMVFVVYHVTGSSYPNNVAIGFRGHDIFVYSHSTSGLTPTTNRPQDKPDITDIGFTVFASSTNSDLNESGITYTWYAFG